MIRRVLQWNPGIVIAYAGVLIVALALADWRLEINVTLGFLYIFPMVSLGTVLNWWQLALAAVFCTLLSDKLDLFPGDMESARDLLIFLTLTITGLLSLNVAKSYRRETESLTARRAAEEQLEILIESSPAAVLTITSEGEILLANPTAHRSLGVTKGMLPGKMITRHVPALGSVPPVDETSRIFRTEMQTRGQKESGEIFGTDFAKVDRNLRSNCARRTLNPVQRQRPRIPAGQKRGCNRARTVSVTRLHATVSGRFAA
jgi:two-component system sensor kinase FixL